MKIFHKWNSPLSCYRHAPYRRPDLKRAFLDFLSSPPLPWPLVKGRIKQIPIGHFQVLNTFNFKGKENLSCDYDFNLHFHINGFALGLRPSPFFFVKRQMHFLILGPSVGMKKKNLKKITRSLGIGGPGIPGRC